MQHSIVYFSKLEKTMHRLDPEYYHPLNLKLYCKLINMPYSRIGDFALVTDGIHESIIFDNQGTINLISAKAPKENYFDLTKCGKIDAKQDAANPRTRLRVNDVIISTVGTIGNCAVVNSSILPANSDRHVGIIRIQKGFKPWFLSTFILSKYGKFQTLRESTGNVQRNLFVYKIKEIIVPKLSESFQEKIEEICLKMQDKIIEAQELYIQAEKLLLSDLGLLDWKPEHQLFSLNFFSTIKHLERMDAEFYQPMYLELQKKIVFYKNGYKTIGDSVNIKDRKFMPKSDVSYKYIELANISENGYINGFIEATGKELPSRARLRVKIGDVIVSSIEGSLSSIALINEDFDNALCSTGFFVVNSNFFNSETLLVLLKSTVGQLQLKKGCSGTILTAISKDEFRRILLPYLPESLQKQIKQKISDMYRKRSVSKKLFDIAKFGIELAIEKNEDEALKWIEQEVKAHA